MSLVGTKTSRANKKKVIHVVAPGSIESKVAANFVQDEGTKMDQPNVFTINKDEVINVPAEEKKISIEEIVADPKMREMALINARQLKEQMHGNWFTLEQLTKKSGIKGLQAALDFMNLICLFEMAYRKVTDKGIMKYKISMCNADLRAVILEDIQEKKDEIKYLEGRLEKLEAKN